MNRTALYLVIFGVIYLLIFSLSYGRSKRWVVPAGEAPDVTLARRRSNRLTLYLTTAIVLGSWIGAAVIYSKGVNISHLSIEIISTSIMVIIWMGIVAVFTWKLRQFSKKLELTGDNEAALLQAIKELKAMRFKFMFWFGMMAGASLLALISNLMSSTQ